MADTSNGNDEEGSETPVNEVNANDSGNRNDEPTVKIEDTHFKYLEKIINVSLDEFKPHKTEREAFSETMDYSMNIVEDWLRRLDTDGRPV